MSESIEMYLLRIGLLQQADEMVPIARLAQELAISPVSAHEMCRKLTEQGLIRYEPYKGVALAPDGEKVACQILRRRRLWEVFLVDKLGIEPQAAEEMACHLEHVALEELIEKLAAYLGNPTLSPQLEPIPSGQNPPLERLVHPLTTLAVGERGKVAAINLDDAAAVFLTRQGIHLGVTLEMMGLAGDGSVLLMVEGRYLSLAQAVAVHIDVSSA